MTDVSTERARASVPEGAVDPALAGLEPVSMWRHFGALARIPHGSGNEEGVREYVKAFTARRGIVCEVNEVGDVLLRVNPDAAGSVVALQAHMDMVCVSKDGAPFDFAHEPIRLKREGGMVCADGTSLGADNGIGVAYALALAEEVTGPLEVLLTVDEEQGFVGIEGVAPGWLKAKALINLDSEEEGYLTIASAGAQVSAMHLPVDRQDAVTRVQPLEVVIEGLKGGHSGVEIHRGRTNALKVAGQVFALARQCGGVVFGVQGGSAPNVIPSSSKATVGLSPERVQEFGARLADLQAQLSSEEDPTLRIGVAAGREGRRPLTATACDKLINVIDVIPSGVVVASANDPTQPFVSNNLAIVKDSPDGGFDLTLMSRSPALEELAKLELRYRAIAEKNGASLVADKAVPGWAPNYQSALLGAFKEKYRELYGKEARVLEIHAGLECGALQAKYPGMDLISVGPDITGVHSPDEKVSVESARRTYDLVRSVIRGLHLPIG